MKCIRTEAGSDLWWMYHSRVAMNVSSIIIIETRNPSSLRALVNLNSLSHEHRTEVLYGLCSIIQNRVISIHPASPTASKKRRETKMSTHSEVREEQNGPSKILVFNQTVSQSRVLEREQSLRQWRYSLPFMEPEGSLSYFSVWYIYGYNFSNYWSNKPFIVTHIKQNGSDYVHDIIMLRPFVGMGTKGNYLYTYCRY